MIKLSSPEAETRRALVQKIKLGIIGAGYWACENYLPLLQEMEGVEVAGVCGLGLPALRIVQEKFAIPFATEDYLELIKLAGLDGVLVCSPHDLHFEHASAALRQGLHVMCEKPMTLRASEAGDLARMAESGNRHFLMPYGWNYTTIAAEARKQVDGGAGVGRIEHVHLHMASALRDLFNGDGAWFAAESLIKPALDTWSNPDRGGGFGHGQLTHALALLFWITQLKATQVFAFSMNSKTGADLSLAIGCRFDNGATGMIGGVATMPPDSIYQVDIRIFGTEGILLLDLERPRLELRRHDLRHLVIQTDQEPGGYYCVTPLRTFVDLIAGQVVENRSPAVLGSRVVELLDAAFRSARSGRMESI